jgi:hypothetical protein
MASLNSTLCRQAVVSWTKRHRHRLPNTSSI